LPRESFVTPGMVQALRKIDAKFFLGLNEVLLYRRGVVLVDDEGIGARFEIQFHVPVQVQAANLG
jgi:hypothetical protein